MVSFGTSHVDTLAKTIDVLERQAARTYPEYQVYRAFTSQVILNKLKRTKNLEFWNVREVLEKMAADGVQEVIVQPTHIINGIENDRMLSDVEDYRECFSSVRVGKPLLSSTEDYRKAARALMEEVEVGADEALLLMGHGTDHHARAAYPALEEMFHLLGYQNVFVGSIESFPEPEAVRKLILFPFLLVAGQHAKKDMAGGENSWQGRLEAAGYEVKPVIRGLGEVPGIRNIFMDHIKDAMQDEESITVK